MSSKQICLHAMNAVLRAADPRSAIHNAVRISNNQALYVQNQLVVENLNLYSQTYIFGAGKVACEMAAALLQADGFAARVNGGLVITKTLHGTIETRRVCAQANVRVIEASHPLPCETGRLAVTEIIRMLHRISSPETLVIWLASGGGSALTGGLAVTESLEETKEIFTFLLNSGLPIEAMNTVRKHMCLAHGGRIAQHAGEQSTVLTLCISDIIDSPVHSIAGGPTAADPTTLEDCMQVLKPFTGKMPPSLTRLLHSNSDGGMQETPKQLTPNILPPIVIMDNKIALEQAQIECRSAFPELRFVCILTHRMDGEAKDMGKLLANMAMDATLPRPFCLLLGGETTVTMQQGQHGLGGRNQELALAAAIQFASLPLADEISLLCIGTDGTDGPTSAAGGVVSPSTLSNDDRKLAEASKALAAHDSFHFFVQHAPEAHITTGPTGTNVMDIVVITSSG